MELMWQMCFVLSTTGMLSAKTKKRGFVVVLKRGFLHYLVFSLYGINLINSLEKRFPLFESLLASLKDAKMFIQRKDCKKMYLCFTSVKQS